jgi:hypothetical protein
MGTHVLKLNTWATWAPSNLTQKPKSLTRASLFLSFPASQQLACPAPPARAPRATTACSATANPHAPRLHPARQLARRPARCAAPRRQSAPPAHQPHAAWPPPSPTPTRRRCWRSSPAWAAAPPPTRASTGPPPTSPAMQGGAEPAGAAGGVQALPRASRSVRGGSCLPGAHGE